jgi:lipoprotein NlpI
MKALLVLVVICFSAFAADAPLSPRAYVHRGMEAFRAGKVAESIKDFEAAVKLQPELKPHLWQLGISYYYAGEYEKGRRLFESHQTVNPEDVENAVWHFLCVTKVENLEAARKAFIPISDDRRIPMKEVHGLFAGKLTREDVLKAARTGNPSPSELNERLCYAYLYVALYEEATNDSQKSLEDMEKAAGEYSQSFYMGDVAKIHLKLRKNKK